MSNEFGKMMAASRERLGLSTEHAALDLGISKSLVWNLENGYTANPTARVLIAISNLYGLSPLAMLTALDTKD